MPNVAAIIGEGGSGGAIAIATANRVLMLEHAIYSVISPEGAASILWRDTAKAQEAASSMKITAQDLVRFGVVDTIVAEPTGGAHREPAAAIAATGEAIAQALGELRGLDRATIVRLRREKFSAIGRTRRLIAGAAAAGRRENRPSATILPRIAPGRALWRLIPWIRRSNSRIIYHSFMPAHGQPDRRRPAALRKPPLMDNDWRVMARGWSICRGVLP